MSRHSTLTLRRYLLDGWVSPRGCALAAQVRPSSQAQSATLLLRQLHQSRQHRGDAFTTDCNSSPRVVSTPLRKQLKDEAKRFKEQQRASKSSKGSKQTAPGWELTVGIEIHAQLNTGRKLFSPAATSFNDEPNSHVALFDVAVPGSQPLFQTDTLVPALRAALVLNCDIQAVSRFDRKHYFWWDQPSGYQITQYYEPFAKDGHIILHARDGIAPEDGESIAIGIKQVQLEQDTAKTLAQTGNVHWLDYNRVGIPLIEIITLPEIHHPRTAAALVRKIQLLLNSVDACVSGMEAGGFRADVNVSVRRTADASRALGTRTEIKNLSTIKAIEDAIIAERDRQIQELESGGIIVGETRGWTLGSKQTRRLRGKEGEVDYRYMPDPDLGPLVIDPSVIEVLKERLGPLPDAELDELVAKHGLTATDAVALLLLDDGARVEYFYNVFEKLEERISNEDQQGAATVDPKTYAVLAANWILHELGRLTGEKSHHDDGPRELVFNPDGECAQVPVAHLTDILYHLYRRRITAKVAKELLVATYLGRLSDGGITATIDTHELWFSELSAEEYDELAAAALEGEEAVIKEFVEKPVYPQGKLMYLVGKMMKQGPTERIHPLTAEQVMRAKVRDITSAT